MVGFLNRVTLMGYLGKAPTIYKTKTGNSIACFSIATTDSWKDKFTGEKREKTEWHNIVVFSEGLTKIAQSYLRKGSKVYIEGKLQTRKWQDTNGQERYITEIVIQSYNGNLIMIDNTNNKDVHKPSNNEKPNYPSSYQYPVELDDEIPF